MRDILPLAIGALLAGCGDGNTMNVDKVEADLRASLPMGSSPARVVRLINDRGYTSDGPVAADELVPVIKDPARSELRSIIRNTRTIWPVRYSITMRFEFDRAQKLSAIEVDEVGTGP